MESLVACLNLTAAVFSLPSTLVLDVMFSTVLWTVTSVRYVWWGHVYFHVFA